MKKSESLTHWKALHPGQSMLKHMEIIPYKSTGSRYGACGIRIDGSPEFIDAVLSNLKELINGENHVTRLELARNPVNGESFGKRFENRAERAEVCYIRLHERGREGVMASAYFDRHLDEATKNYELALD